jgi:hypothetical protein
MSERSKKRRRAQQDSLTKAEGFKKKRLVPPSSLDTLLIPLDSWQWDPLNWSCAYNSYLTVLRCLWNQDKYRWSQYLQSVGDSMCALVVGFEKADVGEVSLEEVRDELRRHLWNMDWVAFPKGKHSTDIYSLVLSVVGAPMARRDRISYRMCSGCYLHVEGLAFEAIGKYVILRPRSEGRLETAVLL